MYFFPSTLPAQPGPPVVTVTTTDSSITLTWNTTLHCFESEIVTFVVIWNEIGSGTSTSVTTSSSPYTISGLHPGTSYQIIVHGVGGSGVVSEARILSICKCTYYVYNHDMLNLPNVHAYTYTSVMFSNLYVLLYTFCSYVLSSYRYV